MYWRVSVLNNGTESESSQFQRLDGGEVAEELQKQAKRLIGKFVADDGSRVDYAGMKDSEEFVDFVFLTSALKKVDPGAFSHTQKLAFFLNVYNILTLHSIALDGPSSNTASRIALNVNAKYEIGGLLYSLHDIENGVLRENRPSPFDVIKSKPFKDGDKRLSSVLIPMDPRIHFALNCGAISCPPIRFFTAKSVEDMLEMVTTAYLLSNDNVVAQQDCVQLSQIFSWYSSDFPSETLDWVICNLPEDSSKRSSLQEARKRSLPVRWLAYDWGTNVKHS
ncbi:hypothetical protein NDN08_006222 [Rhodosorus marinus]|uniref:DUF547 domain-containing protein n=1 Tax=Rhodosorus marinus TaxID=101924 RepID=A0AAV8UP83_9RHOD|nr:hypothetical protein NDN08_006222 [Rhodosorus marinus]